TPRWALGCFWRADGEPLWQQPELLARVDRKYGHELPEAEAFIHALAKRLALPADCVQPAYEDSLYYLWREQQTPDNLEPASADLKDGQERRRLARLLSRGLNEASGFILPVERQEGGP